MKTFTDEVMSFFVGDDIFISYARGDSTGYALALANCLGEKKLICYLDQYGTGINDELDERVINKLKRTRVLVLIGSQRAVDSSPIRREVELFKKTERPIIPIDIDGAFKDTDLYQVVRGLPLAEDPQPIRTSPGSKVENAKEELLHETQTNLHHDSPSEELVDRIVSSIDDLTKSNPSQRVVDRIKSTLNYTKRTELQRRMLWLGSTFLLVSLGLAIVFLYVAADAGAAAEHANNARDEATRDAAAARGEAALAHMVTTFNRVAADVTKRLPS